MAKREAAAAKLQADTMRHDLAQVKQENMELKAAATANKSRVVLVHVLLFHLAARD